MQTRYLANVVKNILLFPCATLFCKSISLVTGETAGKISARRRFIRTGHRDLVAVRELWHTARSHDKRIRQFETRNRRALLAHEAPVIVSAQESYQDVRVCIEIIFGERFGYLVELLALGER